MRKARLGFEIYSLDGELLVEEDKDFVRLEKDKEWASRKKMLANKLSWWNRNKVECNLRRRQKACTIRGRYKASKNKAISVGQKWDLTFDQWQDVWIKAGWVVIPGTVGPSRPAGLRKTAYALRGPNKLENTMMTRKDLTKAWSSDNVYIVFRSAPLNGSIYSVMSGQ